MYSIVQKFIILYFIIALLSFFIYPQKVNADALTALSDTMSREKPSTLSNHTIKFTTPTGVDASTDTITITMPAGFTIGTVDYTDIDLSHGASTGYETEETLAATPAAGVWGAAFASQVLTLTAPTDAAAGEITASDKVIVEIGTNAAGGDQAIQNQAAAATYTISIAGVFGDTGQIAIVIEDSDDQVVVSTTIDPQLSFAITTNTVTLTKAGGGNPDFSNTGFNQGAANTLAASTNGTTGYMITYNGATLTSGANTISAMAAKTTSSAGTEQFGINLKDNATPNTGTEPSGGTGAPESDYNTADNFRFITATATDLAAAAGPSVTSTFTVSYIANVTTITEAGAYSTTITYICTGRF